METLRIGQRFPALEARAVDGSMLRIPDELHDLTAVLIFYRGHW
jgi:peroxiredoxin